MPSFNWRGSGKMLNDLLVQKYGGSSLANLKKINTAARNIQQALQSYNRIVVVVSAMGEFTDVLLEKAKKLSPNPPKRELDMLLTTGERISTSLLCIALDTLGIKATSLTGSQSGILTDGRHGNARIQKILGTRILEGLEKNKVIIVAGFQGVSPETKDITSLGRGGSDLTAVALAASLKAAKCQIYTDVEGIMTADPRVVPQARTIEHLSWQALKELAWAGAQVMHHRGATLAKKYAVPVEMLCSAPTKKKFTRIVGDPMEGPLLLALAHKKNLGFFRIKCEQNPLQSPKIKEVLNNLGSADASPDVFQFTKEQDEWVLTLLLPKRVENIVRETLGHSSMVQGPNLGLVTLVGEGFRQNPELIGEIIASVQTPLEFCQSSDNSLQFVVHEHAVEGLLNELHSRYLTKIQ